LTEKKPGVRFEAAVTTPAYLAPGAQTGMLRLELASPPGKVISIPISAWMQNSIPDQPKPNQLNPQVLKP